MDLLIGASLISAFVAGVAALFAPCCITVLLPSYFASVFREKSKVFLMTFIFFLGIATVFLPLGLGIAALGQVFSKYHNEIFAIGGVFLTFLGISLLLGKRFSLPFHTNTTLKKHNATSVYTLGIFSGIATTCCAPVLAGVLALSVLPGSIFWGGVYTLSYVLGMVAPLFIIALFLDTVNFTKKFMIMKKPITWGLAGKKFELTVADIISGTIFLAMGLFTLYLVATNQLTMSTDYQIDVNITLTKILDKISGITQFVPEYVWAIFALLLISGIVSLSFYFLKKEQYDKD